jgi:hypothetical protein
MFLPPGWDTAALQTVLDRALAKRPDRRFGGMMELARAFEDAAERTLGAGGDAEAPIGLTAAARAARGMAVRLDDAEIDPPPPVRTPAPLVLTPIRRLPTPTPAPLLQPPTPAARPRPATPMAPQMDWEMRNDVDLIPKSHAGVAVLGLLALGAVALLIITGWYKKIPGVGSAVRRQVHEWTRPPGSPPETRIEPAPPAAPVAPAEPSREAASDSTARHGAPPAAPPAAAPPATAAPPAAATPPAAVTPPATATPEASAAPAAPKPRAHRRPAARNLTPRSTARSFAPPPPPAAAPQAAPVQITPPANPPLDGRAFEIAPPKTTDPGRDLAPPSDEAQ